jgi:hypothetical protein
MELKWMAKIGRATAHNKRSMQQGMNSPQRAGPLQQLEDLQVTGPKESGGPGPRQQVHQLQHHQRVQQRLVQVAIHAKMQLCA